MENKVEPLMRIKELVEKSGVPRTTIHYYLRQGLLHPPRKSGRTMAYYDASHIHRLKEIEELKRGSRLPIAFLKEKLKSGGLLKRSTEKPFDMQKTVATTRQKAQKRQQIVRQAIEVFSHKGYHQTKISDITSSLKISTGTFYIYFKDKRELFIEVIDDVFRNIVGEAAVAIKDKKNFADRLATRGRIFYENYSKYTEILNQLRAEMAGEEKWPADKIKKIYLGLTEPVIREIKEAIDLRIIHKVDPDLLAFCLTGSIEIMSLRLSLDRKYDLEDALEFIMDLVIKPILTGNT